MRACIFGKQYKEEHFSYIKTLFDKLEKVGAEVYIYTDYAEQLNDTTYERFSGYDDLKSLDPNLMVTVGGDGTILSASTLIRDLNLPILGINLGRLGFLASTEKNRIHEAIDAWLTNNYILQKRAMLELVSSIPVFGSLNFALNDFAILKRDTSSMIKIHSYINGEFLNSYWADGLIVATPTGSTGYSLSCGGPIIFPMSGNFVVTPVAPHNLNVRPIVIPDDSEISFSIEGRSEAFLCTLDSRYETITDEYELKIKRSENTTNLVLLKDNGFMETIREKLSWGFDTRNL